MSLNVLKKQKLKKVKKKAGHWSRLHNRTIIELLSIWETQQSIFYHLKKPSQFVKQMSLPVSTFHRHAKRPGPADRQPTKQVRPWASHKSRQSSTTFSLCLSSLTENLFLNNTVQLESVRQDWEGTHRSTCEVKLKLTMCTNDRKKRKKRTFSFTKVIYVKYSSSFFVILHTLSILIFNP